MNPSTPIGHRFDTGDPVFVAALAHETFVHADDPDWPGTRMVHQSLDVSDHAAADAIAARVADAPAEALAELGHPVEDWFVPDSSLDLATEAPRRRMKL